MADYNYKSYVKENNLFIDTWEPPSVASIYDDILKFSDCTNVTVTNISVSGGKEDCIDAVRGSNYLFENLNLYPLNNGITIKGSIDGWHLKNILFSRKGEEYTVEIGQFDNYWYPGRPPTRNGIVENLRTISGDKVDIRVWDGEVPKVLGNQNVKITKIPKFIWYPYFLFRRWQINRNK